jgi:hypothetical protein
MPSAEQNRLRMVFRGDAFASLLTNRIAMTFVVRMAVIVMYPLERGAMAGQTKAERSRAGRKGAATRKENEAKDSAKELTRDASGAIKRFGRAAAKAGSDVVKAAGKRAKV